MAALIPARTTAPAPRRPVNIHLADWDRDRLDKGIAAIEAKAEGRLGVALLDLGDRKQWSHRGTETFPLQSVFKLPLAVAVLQQVEAGRFRLDQPITATRKDLSLFHSPLAKTFKGERNDYPLGELVKLAGEHDAGLVRMPGPDAPVSLLRTAAHERASRNLPAGDLQTQIDAVWGIWWTPALEGALTALDVSAPPDEPLPGPAERERQPAAAGDPRVPVESLHLLRSL